MANDLENMLKEFQNLTGQQEREMAPELEGTLVGRPVEQIDESPVQEQIVENQVEAANDIVDNPYTETKQESVNNPPNNIATPPPVAIPEPNIAQEVEEPKLSRQEKLLQELQGIRNKSNEDIDNARDKAQVGKLIAALGPSLAQYAAGSLQSNSGANISMPKYTGISPDAIGSTKHLEDRKKDELQAAMDEYKLLNPDPIKIGNRIVDPSTMEVLLDAPKKQPSEAQALRNEISLMRLEEMKKRENRLNEKQKATLRNKDELSDKQTEGIAMLDNTNAMLTRIKALKKKVSTGPLEGRAKSFARGIMGDSASKFGAGEDFVALKQLIGTNLAEYVKSMSGAAVSEEEAQRLRQNIPTMEDDDKAFNRKVKEFEKTLNEIRSSKIKSYKAQGKDPSNFEKKEEESNAPYGDEVERNGKLYKWNPSVNKYQLK